MIDFRYHLVSLIAVFLALTVGLVLGAGPLRDVVEQTLTGQTEELRADREQLRTELADAEDLLAERDTFLTEAAGALLPGTLSDQRVALVLLPEALPGHVESIREHLELAGASVTAEVSLTESWSDPQVHSFRQSLAGQLAGYIDPEPADDAGSSLVLGSALAAALTDPDGAEELSEDAEVLLELLEGAGTPLIDVGAAPEEPADAVVIIASSEPTPGEDESAADVLRAYVLLAQGAAEVTDVVFAGLGSGEHDPVTAVRDELGGALSTVDSLGVMTASVTVPLAVAAEAQGEGGHYGVRDDAERPLPEFLVDGLPEADE